MMRTNHLNDLVKILIAALVAVAAILLALLVALQPAQATFPGAKGKIVFESNQPTQNPEGDREIFVMNPDGTGLANLTKNSVADIAPAWSPDGRRIAFVSFRDSGSAEIYKMNADGTNQVRLTNDPSASDVDPTWSPDGTKIAWSNGDIRVMNADGSGQAGLTSGAEHDSTPAWSPDGRQIAFAGSRATLDSQGSEIYVIRPEGTGLTNLSKASGDDSQPNWSPDGSQIAFQSNRDGANNFHIYKMKADGSSQTRLTNNPLNPWFNGLYDFAPAWSPDGTKIVFEANRQMSNGMFSNNEIYVMNADGSNQTNLTNTADFLIDRTPDWQPVDNTGPASVEGFTATAGDREVSLSWTNPTDADFDATRIVRSTSGFATGPDPAAEQVQVYEGTATSHADAGLTNGATYYYTAFARDRAGNWSMAANASAKPVPSDASPPTTTATTSPESNEAGWNNQEVTVSLSAADEESGSGVKEIAYSVDGGQPTTTQGDLVQIPTIAAEGETTIAYFAKDNAGNIEVEKTLTIRIDKTKPVIVDDGATTAPDGDNGWYVSPVTNRFSASDGDGSGLADPGKASFQVSSVGEGAAVKIDSGPVSDVAGNVAPGIETGPFQIDLTDPVLNISNAPAEGATVNVCDGLPAPDFSAEDALSGIATSSGGFTTEPTTASGVGTYSYEATATDKAGNGSTVTRTYEVAYGAACGGVLQPISLGDQRSVFRLGSTVPVKFELMCGTQPITDAVARLSVQKVDDTVEGPVNEAVSTSAATMGNLFRYDATSQQYAFNLSTKGTFDGGTWSFSAGTWRLTIQLDDGTKHYALIDLGS